MKHRYYSNRLTATYWFLDSSKFLGMNSCNIYRRYVCILWLVACDSNPTLLRKSCFWADLDRILSSFVSLSKLCTNVRVVVHAQYMHADILAVQMAHYNNDNHRSISASQLAITNWLYIRKNISTYACRTLQIQQEREEEKCKSYERLSWLYLDHCNCTMYMYVPVVC